MSLRSSGDPDGKRLKAGLTISAVAHATLLAWGMVTFAVQPFEAAPVDSLPVDIISASEFSQLTAGVKTAPKVVTPKPMVEKVADATPVKDLAAKVSDKPDITAAAESSDTNWPSWLPRFSISGNSAGATAAMSAAFDPEIPDTRYIAPTST